jgi:hypothetical protein
MAIENNSFHAGTIASISISNTIDHEPIGAKVRVRARK